MMPGTPFPTMAESKAAFEAGFARGRDGQDFDPQAYANGWLMHSYVVGYAGGYEQRLFDLRMERDRINLAIGNWSA